MNATETTPSFETALQKAERALSLRAEAQRLETDARSTMLTLTHAASKATTEDEKAELRRQHQALRRALAGHL